MSTCHSYDIYYKFSYSCSGCGQTFGRHTKSIDLTRQCCARCKGRLRLLGAFDRDGIEIKARAPTGFASFVKERFGALKQERPRLSHGELMAELGKQWKEAKVLGIKTKLKRAAASMFRQRLTKFIKVLPGPIPTLVLTLIFGS